VTPANAHQALTYPRLFHRIRSKFSRFVEVVTIADGRRAQVPKLLQEFSPKLTSRVAWLSQMASPQHRATAKKGGRRGRGWGFTG
jgi:hypothetical protein